jgi:glycosyltransferase involved in cell wall biosynthesis
VKALVVTTSYPRHPGDVAGRFVADAVAAARRAGVDVDVVSPASVADRGIAYGAGIPQNLRARPWLAPLLVPFLADLARDARRAARDADVVHAHWLPSALVAQATGRPYVVQVWGTDVEWARRAPWAARMLLRRAYAVVAASSWLAEQARRLGARRVRVVPGGVDVPDAVVPPAAPPHVLYAGRLSVEKGFTDFLEATEGVPRVIAGDGPLRPLAPDALGFVAPDELPTYYDRAAVVCVPSRREGYGFTAREAMAHGRPVVASRVGGLADAIGDGVTGVLVPPGEPGALRTALVSLLSDEARRSAMGAAAREHAERSFSREVEGAELAGLWSECAHYRGRA